MRNWSYTIKEGEHAGTTLWSGRYCAVSAFIFCYINDEWHILANKRGSGTPDYQGYWNCPCGFLEADESAKEGCAREVREETGYNIPANEFKLVEVETDPAKCNNGNVTLRHIVILHYIPDSVPTEGGEENEVDEIKWMPISQIDKYKWAFNHKDRIEELYQEYAR